MAHEENLELNASIAEDGTPEELAVLLIRVAAKLVDGHDHGKESDENGNYLEWRIVGTG
jgi:hypothetical protein